MIRKMQYLRIEFVYSRGIYVYFLFVDGFDLVCDYVLVGCFGLNFENILVFQSIFDGYFCGIFIILELYIFMFFIFWIIQNDLIF